MNGSDASIYSLIKPVAPPPDPVAQYGQAMQLRTLMGQQELQGLQTDQIRSGIDKENRISALFANGAKPAPERIMEIDRKAGQDYMKSQLEAGKLWVDTDKARAEVVSKNLEINRDLLTNVNDPQSAQQWVLSGYKDPILGPVLMRIQPKEQALQNIPQDPQKFQQWKMQNGLGIEKMLEMTKPDYKTVGAGGQTVVRQMNPNAAGFSAEPIAHTMTPEGRDASSRGWATLAETKAEHVRVADRAKATTDAGKWTNDLERGVQVNMATGETRPITQGGVPIANAGKPLTEAQGRGQMFGTRAAESHNILNALEDAGTKTPGLIKQAAEGVPLVGPSAGFIMNQMPSILGGPNSNQQQVEQAQRNFVNAVLRQESGAVISQPEFDNAKKQYFPQPGDSDAVVQQKKANRESAIEGFKLMSGPAATRIEAARNKAPTKISGDDGYNALPKGARYVGPDGVPRVK